MPARCVGLLVVAIWGFLQSPCAFAVDQTKIYLRLFRSGQPRFAKSSKFEVGNLVPILDGTPLLNPSRAESLGYYLVGRQINHWTLTPILVEDCSSNGLL